MINKDIDFYQTAEQTPIVTVNVNNSNMDYKLNVVKNGFKLVVIRKYIYGHVYIWRKIRE